MGPTTLLSFTLLYFTLSLTFLISPIQTFKLIFPAMLNFPATAVFIFLITTALSPVTVAVSDFTANVLHLERSFPVNQSIEIEKLKEMDRVRHGRLLFDGGNGGVVDFVVQGSFHPFLVGLYYTRVKLGTPPREYNVQIDTGSDLLWVACNSCSDCPKTSDLGIVLDFYDTSKSTTASLVSCSNPVCSSMVQSTSQCVPGTYQCGYSLQFGDGSGTSGFYVSDMFYFDEIIGNSLINNSSASIVFGCSTYQSGDLTKSTHNVDGIFGFGQQSLSVVSQLSSKGLTPAAFSHCLKGDGIGGGILVFGEILHQNIVYSPLVPSQSHYNLELQSIAINGHLLPVDQEVFATSNKRGTIIDSGTTLAYLVEEAYDSFVNGISAAVSESVESIIYKGSHCYLLYSSVSEVFAPVSLNFVGGASMILKPEEYLLMSGISQDGDTIWCMGFQRAQDGVTILGDLVLKDKIIVYDLARQRIGWVNYDCSLPVNVSVTVSKDKLTDDGQLKVSSSSKTFHLETFLALVLLYAGFLIL